MTNRNPVLVVFTLAALFLLIIGGAVALVLWLN
jgi:hypothetical protein